MGNARHHHSKAGQFLTVHQLALGFFEIAGSLAYLFFEGLVQHRQAVVEHGVRKRNRANIANLTQKVVLALREGRAIDLAAEIENREQRAIERKRYKNVRVCA